MNRPEALEFADYLKCGGNYPPFLEDIAVELERQHGEIESMRAERLQTERRLANVKAQRDQLFEALKMMTAHYCNLVNSGDAGNWDPDAEPEVQIARTAIQSVEENPHT